jgi:hypothetical protein
MRLASVLFLFSLAIFFGLTSGGGLKPVADRHPAGDEHCSAEILKFNGLYKDYFDGAMYVRHNGIRYRKAYQKFSTYLAELSTGDCFESVSVHYAIWAYQDLLRFPEKYRESDDKSLRPESTGMKLVLERLAREGKLRPLTPELRKDLGGEWNEHVTGHHSNSFSILGAYDCEDTTIWFDPLLPPLNLGAVIAHEMDHLTRDKITFTRGWENTSKKASLEELLVMDEVLSSLMAGIGQYRLRADSNRDTPIQRSRPYKFYFQATTLFFPRNLYPKFFDVPPAFDGSLFSRDGALDKAWNRFFEKRLDHLSKSEIDQSNSIKGQLFESRNFDGWNKSESWDFAVNILFKGHGLPVFGGLEHLYAAFLDDDARADLEAIVRLVADRYFPGKIIDYSRISGLLQQWLESRYPENTIEPLRDALSVPRGTERVADEIQSHFGEISPGCQAISKAIRNGDIMSLGLDDSTRPGKEGTRPGKEGTRPGKEGTRPGKEGTRPGKAIKACLWPEEKM